jgi:hypothetical protein
LVEAEEVPLAEIVHLGEADGVAAADRVARDAAAVDAAADDEDVVFRGIGTSRSASPSISHPRHFYTPVSGRNV